MAQMFQLTVITMGLFCGMVFAGPKVPLTGTQPIEVEFRDEAPEDIGGDEANSSDAYCWTPAPEVSVTMCELNQVVAYADCRACCDDSNQTCNEWCWTYFETCNHTPDQCEQTLRICGEGCYNTIQTCNSGCYDQLVVELESECHGPTFSGAIIGIISIPPWIGCWTPGVPAWQTDDPVGECLDYYDDAGADCELCCTGEWLQNCEWECDEDDLDCLDNCNNQSDACERACEVEQWINVYGTCME